MITEELINEYADRKTIGEAQKSGFIIGARWAIAMLKDENKQKILCNHDAVKLVYCNCKNKSSFYRDKEDNDICYKCDLMIKQ